MCVVITVLTHIYGVLRYKNLVSKNNIAWQSLYKVSFKTVRTYQVSWCHLVSFPTLDSRTATNNHLLWGGTIRCSLGEHTGNAEQPVKSVPL